MCICVRERERDDRHTESEKMTETQRHWERDRKTKGMQTRWLLGKNVKWVKGWIATKRPRSWKNASHRHFKIDSKLLFFCEKNGLTGISFRNSTSLLFFGAKTFGRKNEILVKNLSLKIVFTHFINYNYFWYKQKWLSKVFKNANLISLALIQIRKT